MLNGLKIKNNFQDMLIYFQQNPKAKKNRGIKQEGEEKGQAEKIVASKRGFSCSLSSSHFR